MHCLAAGNSTLFGSWNLPELSSHDWRQLRDDKIRTHHRAVLDRRMGNFLSCTGAGPALGVAVASGDTAAAHQILHSHPESSFYRPNKHARTLVAQAADKGNLALLKGICEAAETAKGTQYLQTWLSTADRGDSALTIACSYGSVEHAHCMAYLLSKGADPSTVNSMGDNALHVAARNASAACIQKMMTSPTRVKSVPASCLADVVCEDSITKFVDLPNDAGMTAIHLATLKGSASALFSLLRHGAAADAQIVGTSITPWLSQGSTALHIAAARGYVGCVTVLLEFQATVPGMELRRVRNLRGLKASQVARMGGHHGLARLLSDTRNDRRRRTRPAQLTPDALLAILVQRARLLMSLRTVALQAGSKASASSKALQTHAEEEDVALPLAEVLDAWRKGTSSKDYTGGLAALAMAFEPASPLHALPASKHQEPEEDDAARGQKSYAAAAIVQAALNAMASASPQWGPMDALPDEMAPTTPAAAAAVLHAALRMLATQPSAREERSGSRRRPRRPQTSRHRPPSASLSAAVQSVLAMQQSSREHRSGGLSLRSKLAGPHSGPLSGPANPAALLSAPASLTARLLGGQGSGSQTPSPCARTPTNSAHGTHFSSARPTLQPATDAGSASRSRHSDGDPASALRPPAGPPSRLSAKGSARAAGASQENRTTANGSGLLAQLASQSAPPTQRGAAHLDLATPWPLNSADQSGHHQAARPAALRTMPLPELDSLAARPAGAGLSDALLDSSAGLDASRPAVDEVLATQQDDELSGSDAEGTPRAARSTAGPSLATSQLISTRELEAAGHLPPDSGDLLDDDEISATQVASRRLGENECCQAEQLDRCAICMDKRLQVRVGGCQHPMCRTCAYQLCARGLTAPACPFCRATIRSFRPIP